MPRATSHSRLAPSTCTVLTDREEDLVACSVLGQLAWLAAILWKDKPVAGCTSATLAATPGNEGGEEFSLPSLQGYNLRPGGHFYTGRRRGRPLRRHVPRRPGESICHHVGCPGDVADVRGILCHEGQLPGLVCCPRLRHPSQGIGERLVVCEDGEPSAVQHVPEVPYPGITGKQLPVKGGIYLLGRLQLL